MKNRRTASTIAVRTAALLLIAVVAHPHASAAALDTGAAQDTPRASADPPLAAQASRAPGGTADAAPSIGAKKAPQAKSKAEFDAYQSAAAEVDAARLETAATNFAQRFPSSELRPFLFQRAMGLYQQRNDSAKALQMARAVLKYDPTNAVALLGAAQLLAEGAHEHDLDREARLEEAAADARLVLQHAGELAQPAGMSTGQFESMIVELRAEAHEVLGTVAYKRRDYRTAIEEYSAALAVQKEKTAAVVWLRLAAAHDKLGEYSLGIAAIEKGLASSEPGEAGGPLRELAERELARLKALAAEAARKAPETPIETPNVGSNANLPPNTTAAPPPTPTENPAAERTENSRSPAAGE